MGNSNSNNDNHSDQDSSRISISDKSVSSASLTNKFEDDLEGHGHREQIGLAEAPCNCGVCNLFEDIYLTGEGMCFFLLVVVTFS